MVLVEVPAVVVDYLIQEAVPEAQETRQALLLLKAITVEPQLFIPVVPPIVVVVVAGLLPLALMAPEELLQVQMRVVGMEQLQAFLARL
jgi:hypothetical protein